MKSPQPPIEPLDLDKILDQLDIAQVPGGAVKLPNDIYGKKTLLVIDGKREVKAQLTKYIEERERLARIDELETFQWNDAHMHIRTRLSELKNKETL
jgi:hypothetical protein